MSAFAFKVGQRVKFNHCGRLVTRTVRQIMAEGKAALVQINGYTLWLKPRRVIGAKP
jgi:hypothetical protein